MKKRPMTAQNRTVKRVRKCQYGIANRAEESGASDEDEGKESVVVRRTIPKYWSLAILLERPSLSWLQSTHSKNNVKYVVTMRYIEE